MTITYDGIIYKITTKETVVICGIAYGVNNDEKYIINVKEKMAKLEKKLSIWTQRYLTQEGKY